MKKLSVLIAISVVFIIAGMLNGLVNEKGNVGINTKSPNYMLHVNESAGKPGGGSWSDFSDERLKKNVQNLESALEKISQLQAVTFEWINPEEHGNQSGTQAGLIAQEVEEVFPDWVSETEPTGKDKELVEEGEKVKSLQFPNGFNAYLIEAIKELKEQNENLEGIIAALEDRHEEKIVVLENRDESLGQEIERIREDHEEAIEALKVDNESIRRENEALRQEIEQIKEAIGL